MSRWMKTLRTLVLALLLAVGGTAILSATGCQPEEEPTVPEEIEEAVDNAAEQAEEALD